MRYSTFLRAGGGREAAHHHPGRLVLRLDIVRNLGRHRRSHARAQPEPRSNEPRSRYPPPGQLVPARPARRRGGVSSSLETLGPTLPQRAIRFAQPRRVHRAAFAAPSEFGLVHRAVSIRWDVISQVHDQRRPDGGGLARRRRHAEDRVFISSCADRGRAASASLGFPAVLKQIWSLAFVPLPPPHPRRRDPGRAAAHLRQGRRPRRAGPAERIPGGEDELWTVGSYLDAESRPLAVPARRRAGQYPHAGGGCFAGVSRWDDALADAALAAEAPLPRRSARSSSSATRATGASSWRSTRGAGSGAAGPGAVGVNLSYTTYRDAVGNPWVWPAPAGGGVVDRRRRGRATRATWPIGQAPGARPSTCARCGARMDSYALDDPLPGPAQRRHRGPASPGRARRRRART